MDQDKYPNQCGSELALSPASKQSAEHSALARNVSLQSPIPGPRDHSPNARMTLKDIARQKAPAARSSLSGAPLPSGAPAGHPLAWCRQEAGGQLPLPAPSHHPTAQLTKSRCTGQSPTEQRIHRPPSLLKKTCLPKTASRLAVGHPV